MNTADSRQSGSEWAFGVVFLLLALLLLGFNGWLRFFVLEQVNGKVAVQQHELDSAKAEQAKILSPQLRGLFERYSKGIGALQSVFQARDDIFSGSLDEKQYEPIVLLDYLATLDLIKKHLSKTVVMGGLSIDPVGKISFVIQAPSYQQAAVQMAALEFSFSGKDTGKKSDRPVFLSDFSVSSISRNPFTGKPEEIPLILRGLPASYNFIVQAKLNPEYFMPSK